MKYMLDTNICIFIMKEDTIVLDKLKTVNFSDICISAISLSELEYGVFKSQQYERNRKILNSFIEYFSIIPYSKEVATEYGKIRAELEKIGKPIGSMDMLIAAHALTENLTLITNNKKEFVRINHLKIEDWKN